MSSLQSQLKQIPSNNGYFITVGDVRNTFYQQTGTDAVPAFTQSFSTLSTSGDGVSTLIAAAGGILRDHGKTLVSSGRVFRKVQIMTGTRSILVNGTDGVQGVGYSTGTPNGASGYLTGYIELPGTGGMSSGVVAGTTVGSVSLVARLG
jgi:hypothetical protein